MITFLIAAALFAPQDSTDCCCPPLYLNRYNVVQTEPGGPKTLGTLYGYSYSDRTGGTTCKFEGLDGVTQFINFGAPYGPTCVQTFQDPDSFIYCDIVGPPECRWKWVDSQGRKGYLTPAPVGGN